MTQPFDNSTLLSAATMARAALQPRPPARSIRETVGMVLANERAIRALDHAVAAGKALMKSHVLIPIDKLTVHRVLPDIDDEQIGQVLGSFCDHLETNLLEEHLPDLARDVCGARMRF